MFFFRKIFSFSLLLLTSVSFAQTKPTAYVNAFIGTGANGNTYPGAQAPFGMISISPSNTFTDYDNAYTRPGYKYGEKEIRGFALTHFSGVGCHAMQDIMFMPANEITKSPVNDRSVYKSRFTHAAEKASPGFYSVSLQERNIDVQFTADKRSGIGEIDYKNNEDKSIVFAPTNSSNGISAGELKIDTANNCITGYITTGGFCWRDPSFLPYKIFFVVVFDTKIAASGTWKGEEKFESVDTATGNNIAAYLTFAGGARKVKMRTAISFVSVKNAMLNLQSEIPSWNFNSVYARTHKDWEQYLNRIKIEGGTEDERTVFYTAVYHNLLQPNIFEDVNGEYIGFDFKNHTMEKGRSKYVNFSMWDTYRTTACLQAMIAPKESSDMVQSLLLDAQQGGAFPNWSMNNQEYGVMNGYSAFPFIANMYACGATDFDLQGVKDMMKKVSVDYFGCQGRAGWANLDDYKKYGYVPVDKHGYGASMTIEYAIDDHAIGNICKAAGDTQSAAFYFNRSQNVFKLYNPATGFLQGRNIDGSFIQPFDSVTEKGYNEGNATQYFWSVPHGIDKLIQMAGGDKVVEKRLDAYMSNIEVGWAPEKPYYWIGNEPCFNAVYVYNYLGAPQKAQYNVRRIVNGYYKNTPDGLPGDDDVGAMSALYIFSAMGMYPYVPGDGVFTITGPLFNKISIEVPGRKSIVLKSATAQNDRAYISKMYLNGKQTSNLWIDWKTLSEGAVLDFTMSK